MQSSIDIADIKTLVDSISSLLEVFQVCLICGIRDVCTDRLKFESSIAVEKRLGLIVEVRSQRSALWSVAGLISCSALI